MRKGIIIGGAAVAVAIIAIGIGANAGKSSTTDTANAAPAATSASAEAPASASSAAPTTTAKPVVAKVSVPSVIGLFAETAQENLKKVGLTISVTGDTSQPSYQILSQTPNPATKVEPGTLVTVVVGESAAQKTLREATEKLAADKAAKDAEEAAKAAADADLSTFIDIDSRSWAQIAKSPDTHVGEKYIVYGHVTQFDSGTGTTAFRASTDGVQQDKYYDYDINTMVNAKDAASVGDVVTGDLLKMWVRVTGSLTYSNTMGGSTTVPQVVIINHELIGTAD